MTGSPACRTSGGTEAALDGGNRGPATSLDSDGFLVGAGEVGLCGVRGGVDEFCLDGPAMGVPGMLWDAFPGVGDTTSGVSVRTGEIGNNGAFASDRAGIPSGGVSRAVAESILGRGVS
jgi:hypothetical protein